jgi:hypothetical protein
MDVVVWLRSLGLGRYEAAFRENDIDETVLPKLTAEDPKDLGITAVGHRRKLLEAIAELGTDACTAAADEVRHGAAPARRDGLGGDGMSGGNHATNKHALNQSQDQEEDWRRHADHLDCGQETERRGRYADADHGYHHRPLAPVAVGIRSRKRRIRQGASAE